MPNHHESDILRSAWRGKRDYC